MPDVSESQGGNPKDRAAVYIDGYNLYHSIHEMKQPFLKWCNLWRLSELMCDDKKLTLVKVVFCTAIPHYDIQRKARHNTYNNALRACGVKIIDGHHVFDPDLGKYSEKQSDINVSLSLIFDGLDGVYNWAFLVSADSDQAATARVFMERLPDKKLVAVAPPNRKVPDKVVPYAKAHFVLSEEKIEMAIMPTYVRGLSGNFIRRPREYDPPDWWVHPNQRPKRARRPVPA